MRRKRSYGRSRRRVSKRRIQKGKNRRYNSYRMARGGIRL